MHLVFLVGASAESHGGVSFVVHAHHQHIDIVIAVDSRRTQFEQLAVRDLFDRLRVIHDVTRRAE